MEYEQIERTYTFRLPDLPYECTYQMVICRREVIDETFRYLNGKLMTCDIGLSEDKRREIRDYFEKEYLEL